MSNETLTNLHFVERLNKLRLTKGLSWKETAEAIGLSTTMLHFIRKGRHSVTDKVWHRLEQAEIRGRTDKPVQPAQGFSKHVWIRLQILACIVETYRLEDLQELTGRLFDLAQNSVQFRRLFSELRNIVSVFILKKFTVDSPKNPPTSPARLESITQAEQDFRDHIREALEILETNIEGYNLEDLEKANECLLTLSRKDVKFGKVFAEVRGVVSSIILRRFARESDQKAAADKQGKAR